MYHIFSTQEKQKIRKCFNKAAISYDDNSDVQFIIGKNIIEMLSHYIKPHAKIIDLGCAAGKLTLELANRFPTHLLIALDIAENLLAVAKPRLTPRNIAILHADFDYIPLQDNSVDVVFSNMALHWGARDDTIFKESARILMPGGILAFSIPVNGTFFELMHSQQQAGSKNLFDRFTATTDIIHQLNSNGFKILAIKIKNYVLYFDNLVQLIKSIKDSGTNFAKNNLNTTLKTKKYFQQLEQSYFEFFSTVNGQLPLTYSIVSVIARG